MLDSMEKMSNRLEIYKKLVKSRGVYALGRQATLKFGVAYKRANGGGTSESWV